jgi:hypothetical protein
MSTRLRVEHAGDYPGFPHRRIYAVRTYPGAGTTDPRPSTHSSSLLIAIVAIDALIFLGGQVSKTPKGGPVRSRAPVLR